MSAAGLGYAPGNQSPRDRDVELSESGNVGESRFSEWGVDISIALCRVTFKQDHLHALSRINFDGEMDHDSHGTRKVFIPRKFL
jgi:hypothetical protein